MRVPLLAFPAAGASWDDAELKSKASQSTGSKAAAREAIESLPDKFTWDDVIDRIISRASRSIDSPKLASVLARCARRVAGCVGSEKHPL